MAELRGEHPWQREEQGKGPEVGRHWAARNSMRPGWPVLAEEVEL